MQKKLCTLLLSTLAVSMLSGCGRTANEKDDIQDLTENGEVSWQTATTGIDETSKKFETNLVSGNYYVLHDGFYYPLASYVNNYENDKPEDRVNKKRQQYFTTENEIEIPTLYDGDQLIYYSTDTLLDTITWERYYDIGYTIGCYNIKQLTNTRSYLKIAKDDDICILPDSELYEIYNLGVDNALLDKIGDTTITEDMVEDGLIKPENLQKSGQYDLEVYAGTYYNHYLTTANMHAFRAYELYASVEYETLRDCFYRVEIPDYFVTGYYDVNGNGMLRLVRGTSYSENTDFNEQVLFPEVDTSAADYDPNEYVAPRIYSSFGDLNQFKTNVTGALGYVDEDAKKEDQEAEDAKKVDVTKATKKEIELYFPADTDCSVTIKSATTESTGDIYISIGSSIVRVPWDRVSGLYTADVKAKRESRTGTLTITGLFTSYDVSLVGCEQYVGQDGAVAEETETTDTENTEETTTETESETTGN